MYEQSITRRHRTAFLILIDQSGSMAERIDFLGRRMTKAEAVAEVTDSLLFELIERSRRDDGIRNYYDIGLIGYSGEGVGPLIGDRELYPIDRLAALPYVMRTMLVERRMPDGSPALHRIQTPSRIAAKATGQTPMFEALLHVHDLTAEWCSQPQNTDSFPPVVFHITDGEASDCDEEELLEVASRIRGLHTADGNVLLMNLHIATGGNDRPLLFPTREQMSGAGRYARQLYDCSSEMPRVFDALVQRMRADTLPPPYRAMAYNASITEVASMLTIGSVSVPIH